MGRGGLVQTLEDRGRRCPERAREHRWSLAPSLSSSQMGGNVTGVSKHKANCRTFYANTETKLAQIHFTQLQALKKWTVVETFVDPT